MIHWSLLTLRQEQSTRRTKITTSVQANILEGQEIFDRVFIEDLSRETIELELETRFWSIGEVVDVRIVCDRKTGLNKGCGYVTFETTIVCNELLKNGMVDYKNRRRLRLRKAVKKEASSQFLVGETSLSSQTGSVSVPVANEFSATNVLSSANSPNLPTRSICSDSTTFIHSYNSYYFIFYNCFKLFTRE